MRKSVKAPFDPQKFLAKVGDGKTILTYRKNQIVFSQGSVADAVFYIQQGNIKLIHQPEAVVLDLVNPVGAGRGLVGGRWEARFDEARPIGGQALTQQFDRHAG